MRSAESIARDEFIVRMHGIATPKQLARELGISREAVIVRRQRLADRGLIEIKRTGRRNTWAPDEDRYFRENIGHLPLEEIAKHLGRSMDALKIHRKKNNIPTQRASLLSSGIYNAIDVGEILGQDPSQFVIRQIIRWGLVKARKIEHLHAGGHAQQWGVKREDLVDFLIDWPWQYDRTRIKDPFFRRVADEAWNRDPLYTTAEAAAMLGFRGRGANITGQHGMSSFLRMTAPKFVPRSKLIVRRKGRPGASGKSLAGMETFIPRSTIEAIKASGWVNVRTVIEDPNWWTAERAGKALMADPARPPYVTRSVLRERLYRFYGIGAIPTRELALPNRAPWRLAKRTDVLAMKDALFAHPVRVAAARLGRWQRRLVERHEPELLERPRDLVLQQTTGELGHKIREWHEWEQRAIRDLHWRKTRSWALVTKHVARMLEHLGPKTRLGGRKRLRIYHLGPCSTGLVEVPLWLARKRGLEICEHCEFESKFRRQKRDRVVPIFTCVACRTTYRRGPGRPPKLPTCPDCLRKKAA